MILQTFRPTLAPVGAALTAALALPLAGCIHVRVSASADHAPPARLAGTWEGTGVQSPAGVDAETWPMKLVLDASGDGAVSYPTLGCGGPLTRIGRRGETIRFNEVITYGMDKCVKGGTVTLVPAGGKLFWYWTGENSEDPEMTAAAVLTRTGD